jgi:hypothetical protein
MERRETKKTNDLREVTKNKRFIQIQPFMSVTEIPLPKHLLA